MGYKVVPVPRAWGENLPFIGDDIAKIGQIYELYAVPCSPDPIIWVYGFFSAIPMAAASLLKPELIDINIKHRRGKPRKGKKYKFRADFFFRDAIVEIPVPRWVAFRVYELSQRIGWYFLVADVTEDFAINWMSAAYKYNGCSTPNLTYFRAGGVEQLQGGNTGGGNYRLQTLDTAASNIGTAPFLFTLFIAGTYRMTWTVSLRPYSDPNLNCLPITTFLYDETAGAPVDVGELGNNPDGTAYASGSVVITLDSGVASFSVAGTFPHSGYCWADLVVTVDKVSGDELSPDP